MYKFDQIYRNMLKCFIYIPENPVFIVKFCDPFSFLYLAFVPDTIRFFKTFLKNFWLFFGFCTDTNCENEKIIVNFYHLYQVLNSLKTQLKKSLKVKLKNKNTFILRK